MKLTLYAVPVLFATCGAALSSPPDNRAQSQNRGAAQSAEQSLSDIAASLKEANKSQQPDPGCKQGQDNRSSDLCAQWKAADAADISATWTRRTFWLTLAGVAIGGATLFAAAFAAWYAKSAAKEAWRGANAAEADLNHSRETSALELRPWVSAAIQAKCIRAEGQTVILDFDIVCENHGASVARSFTMDFKVLFYKTNLTGFSTGNVSGAVMPGERYVYPVHIRFGPPNDPWFQPAEQETQTAPYVEIDVSYRGTGGESEAHITRRSYWIAKRGVRAFFTKDQLAVPLGEYEIESRPKPGIDIAT